jgi:hypothetical protein
MKLVAPRDIERSTPFQILDGPSERGPRLGGRAPHGVGDGILRLGAKYVMTVPLASEPALELSVFVQGELWAAMNAGLFSDDRIVAIAAPPSVRRRDSQFRSPLTEHRIVLCEEDDDLEHVEGPDVDPNPFTLHKLGGRPFCIQEPELQGAAELQARGYTQLVQLAVPTAEDAAISGPWPFADGLFNLFGTPPFETFFWAFQK